MSKQYAERDASALDEAGGYYIRHVSAMTKEGLHSKSDIAAELAFRDLQIDQLNHRINRLLTERNATGLAIERAISGQLPLTDHPLAERFRMIAGLSATRNALEVQVDILEQQRDEFLRDMQDVLDMLINQPHAVTAANQAEDMLRLSIATASSRVKGGAACPL